MSARERFEAWWAVKANIGMVVTKQGAWAVWQAARAEALEEAVAECERISLASKSDGYVAEAAAEQGCANAIRALKDKEPA